MKVLILRTCDKNMKSHGGFKWKKKGVVKCDDWDKKQECGNGLHGLLWGVGDGSLLSWDNDAVWMVLEVESNSIVYLQGKVKFPKCVVRFCGDRKKATDYLQKYGAADKPVVGCYKTGGYRSTLTGGEWSTLTGGYRSTLTGGEWSTLTGGYWSTLTGGYRSTLTGGYGSTLTGGYWSTLTGGYGSTLTGGDGSTLTGGEWSTLNWKIWDGRYWRITTVYVGENGIKKDTKYKLENGKVVEVAE